MFPETVTSPEKEDAVKVQDIIPQTAADGPAPPDGQETAAAPEIPVQTQPAPQPEEEPVVIAGKEEIPPLSRSEREHLTYLRVLGEYNIAKDRRRRYKRYGALFIILSGILFLTLIFSLEAKIFFLCLWILTILCCVAFMIRADYVYDTLKEYLGFADEYDLMEKEEEEEEDK